MRCPISFIPLSELEHPVVFRNQRALVVYDAEHLLTWLRTTRRNPITNERLSPITPLCDLLLPHRLPHTTDAHLTATQRLLTEGGSGFAMVSAATEQLFSVFLDLLFVPFTTAWMTLIVVSFLTVMLDTLNELTRLDLTLVDMPLMEWMVRHQAMAVVSWTRVYMDTFHPLSAYFLGIFFGPDLVTRMWCNGLARVKAAPLFCNATGLGIDVLLTVCGQ